MSEQCACCNLSESAHIVYEDERAVAVLASHGCAVGHVEVFPKAHHATLEEMPQDDVDHLFFVANTSASVLFEALGLGGTNVIVNNIKEDEHSHVVVHVIPRKPDDGLDFMWQPQRLQEADMSDAQSRIADETFMITFKPKQKPVINLDEKDDQTLTIDEKSDLYKHLRRVP